MGQKENNIKLNFEPPSRAYLLNCQKSNEALSDILQNFKADWSIDEYSGNYWDSFNDSFAGLYLDGDGFLNFCTVGIDDLDVGNHAGQVIHRKYKYSYNYLRGIQNIIEPVMREYNICGVGADMKNNQVSVDFKDDKCVGGFIEFLKNQGVYHEDILKIRTGVFNRFCRSKI